MSRLFDLFLINKVAKDRAESQYKFQKNLLYLMIKKGSLARLVRFDIMLSVGIVGLGTIGSVVAKALDSGIAGMTLVAVLLRDVVDKAMANLANLSSPVDLMTIDEVSKAVRLL